MVGSDGAVQRELGVQSAKLEGLQRALDEMNRRVDQERTDRRQEALEARQALNQAMQRAYDAQKAYERAMWGKLKLIAKVAFWSAMVTAALVGLFALADPTGFKLIFRWLSGH